MIRRPPRSTRTDTLFPYTTLFRSKTRDLIESVVTVGVPHFIFSSTAATYGIPEESPVRETTPQRPINPYGMRSEEHTSELQSLMRISYAVFCLKKKKKKKK